MASLESAREALVRSLSERIRDPRVIRAIANVPREAFVPSDVRRYAYEDTALPIGEDQTISQPTIVAMMTAALALQGDEVVLEVGTGSGYQTAVLAALVGRVVSVERHTSLAARAAETLRRLGITNAEIHESGGKLGWPGGAPYDAIIVTAAAPMVPQSLLDQLKEGGRLVIPVGLLDHQDLMVVTKQNDRIVRQSLGPCRFVPLIGLQAWSEEAAG